MRKIKHAVTTSLAVLCLIGSIAAQTPGFNYYDFVDAQDHYFDSIRTVTPDTLKVPGLRSYERWKDFWMNRVHNDASVTGSMSEYSSKLISSYSNPAMQAGSTTGYNWELAGPVVISTHNKGIIVSLWIDPDNIDVIFAGSNTAGMFATQNGGSEWTNVTDNIGLPAIGVNDIAVHPTNKNIKYIAVSVNHHDYLSLNQPAYIYKTTDNCATWTPVLSFLPSENVKANRVIIDPQNPDILYALIKGQVYRTMDAGATWISIFNQLSLDPDFWNTNKHLLDIEFNPNDPNTLYISSNGISEAGNPDLLTAELWTTNNAQDLVVVWTRITNGIHAFTDRIGIETDPQNPNSLYILYTIGISDYEAKTFLKKAEYPSFQVQPIFEKQWTASYGKAFAGTGYWCMNIEISPSNPDIAYIAGWNLQA